jgi:hypothetical protein
MRKIQSVYIVEPVDQGWIIERLMRDISAELNMRGIPTRIGKSEDYRAEEIIFNSRFLTALSDARAKVNALFITHIDDSIKEMQLRGAFKAFNSFVCMSAQDAAFVSALRGDHTGVAGIDLPARNDKVRPTRLAMFSAFYEDGRKNEQWIAEYFRDKPASQRHGFVFCFMGWGWEPFCATLGDLEMNYEIYRYSRFTPGEYELYKEALATTDALIYLGFDGGAMSVYDAINAGIDVIAPNTSYHRGLGDAVALFDDRAGFFAQMDRLQRRYLDRRDALQRRSVVAYTDQLVAHWQAMLYGEPSPPGRNAVPEPAVEADAQVLALFRGRYKKLGLSRLRSALIRSVQSRFLR